MATISTSKALNAALREEMLRDDRVFCPSGEDVKDSAYAVTEGLYDQFGPGRIIGTPISEAGDCRRRGGRRSGRGATGRRDHVHDLPDHRHGSTGQPGRQDEIHVRRQGPGYRS